MKTILALDLGKFKTVPCLLTQNAGTVAGYFLAHSNLIGFFSSQGLLAGRFKVRPCFYPSSQGDPAYVSLSVLENRQDLGRTVRLGRAIQCSRRASVPRAALRSALGYLLLPLWGGRIGSRPEARGGRPEARGNSQTAGKLWCDPPQVSKDHDACRLDSQEFSDDPKRIAPRPYDLGRGCDGLPGLKTIS